MLIKNFFFRVCGTFFICVILSMSTKAQIVLHDAGDVTQTKVTLSADFPYPNETHGFQYKYGTLPEIDDFSRLALAELSDPVQLTTTGDAWSARTVKGWVESKSGLSAGKSSVMSATVSFTEQTEVSFEWSVDSEDGIGVLSFIVDGTTVESISGLVGFTKVTYTAEAGEHTLQWQYRKSAATNVGLDIGMVRRIDLQNTTEGTWQQYSEKNPRGLSIEAVPLLTPNRDYLFRAYQTVNGERMYSIIKNFCTLPITVGNLTAEATQTTATFRNTIDAGDAPITARYSVGYLNLSADQQALLHKNSDPVASLTKDPQWYIKDGVMTFSAYTTATKSLAVTFTLTDTATVSFDWSTTYTYNNSETFRLYCYIDNKLEGSISSASSNRYTATHYSKLLDAGTHTLRWTTSATGAYGSVATVSNLHITNAKVSPDLINWGKSSVAEVSDSIVSAKLYGLRPNFRYMAQLLIESVGAYKDSTKCVFTTPYVSVDTLPVTKLSQASATIRGKVDSGDALVEAVGLQYKDATGSRWTAFPKEKTDSLFSHDLTRLRPNTKYNYRSYIQIVHNDTTYKGSHPVIGKVPYDTLFSEIGEFTTLAVEARMPVVVERTLHTAELQGKVIFGDASIYQRGMQFRRAGSEEWEDTEDGGTDSVFTLKKTGLLLNTAYEARTYIQPAGSDIIYSDVLHFYTRNNEAYTDSVSAVQQRSAVVHGHFALEDGDNYTKSLLLYDGNALKERYEINSTDNEFAVKISGLSPDHTYKAIAEATNPALGGIVSGDINFAGMNSADTLFARNLMNEVNENIVITRGTGWSGYGWKPGTGQVVYTGPYNYANDELTLTFTLTDQTAISFECEVIGLNDKYSKVYYNYLDLYVDGTKTMTISAEDASEFKTFCLERPEGEHMLKWDPYVWDGNSYKAHIRNLSIPNVKALKPFTFKTEPYFKGQQVTNITQTKARLTAQLSSTNDTYEKVGFILRPSNNDTDMQEVVAEIVNDSLVANVSGLVPNTLYYYVPFVVVDGQYYYARDYSFRSKDLDYTIRIDKMTQSTIDLHMEKFDTGDAEISGLQYLVASNVDYIYNIQDTDSLTDYPKDGKFHLTGLHPGCAYTLVLAYQLKGKRHSTTCWRYEYYNETEKRWKQCDELGTLPIQYSFSLTHVGQTSAYIHFSSDCGTATFVAYGVEINDSLITTTRDSLVITELDFNSDYRYCTFIEIEEGGRYYSTGYYYSKDNKTYYDFHTPGLAMTTQRPSSISNRSATMNGMIDCDSYSSAEFGFQWKQMEGWNSEPAFTKGVKKDDGNISVALVNGMLEPNTDYQYRTAVRYKGQIYYADNWETFRTESEYVYYPASVYTVFRTDRENNRLILCGYYVAGSETVAAQGYEYWNEQSNVRAYGPTAAAGGNVVFIATDESMQYALDLKTLADGNYSVRAFVTTSSGVTIYGETLTFGVKNGQDAIEDIEYSDIRMSAWGQNLTIHNATALSCRIYTLNGNCVAQRRNMGTTETFVLQQNVIYIVRLGNNRSYKIKL